MNPMGIVGVVAGSALGFLIASAFITAANVTGVYSTLLNVSLIVIAGAGAFYGISQMQIKK